MKKERAGAWFKRTETRSMLREPTQPRPTRPPLPPLLRASSVLRPHRYVTCLYNLPLLVAMLTCFRSGYRRERACRPQQHAGTAAAVPSVAVPAAALRPSSPVAVCPWIPAVCRIPTAVPVATPWPLAATTADAGIPSVAGSPVRRSADVAPGPAPDAGSDVGIHGHQAAHALLSVSSGPHWKHLAARRRTPCASDVRGALFQPRRHGAHALWPGHHCRTQHPQEAGKEDGARRDGRLSQGH